MFAAVRRTVAIVSLGLAWLFANGAVLDVVQVIAWGKMVRDFNRAGLTFEASVRKTLDGSAPCEICSAVQQAKKQTPAAPVEHSAQKLVLACTPADLPVVPPALEAWPAPDTLSAPMRSEAVPLRPPRLGYV